MQQYLAVSRVVNSPPSNCFSLGECNSGETTRMVETSIQMLCKCYLLGCRAGLKTKRSSVLTHDGTCSVPRCHYEHRLRLHISSSAAPAEDTGKRTGVLHPFSC